MTEPSRWYDVTITVDRDGSQFPNPAEFAVTAQQAVSARGACIVSAYTAGQIISVVIVPGRRQARGRRRRAGRGIRSALDIRPHPPPLGAALLLRPDRSLRRRRARIRAVHPQLPLQLSDPQLQPPPQLPLRPQFRTQHSVLASFASTTARSRASSSRCSPAAPDGSGSPDTSPKLAQPELEVQTPQDHGVPRRPASLKSPSPVTEQVRRTPLSGVASQRVSSR
jgi:hypothetical protein